jgi:hypothetical protein
MFVYGLFKVAGLTRVATRLIEVEQDGRRPLRELLRAGDDVLLCVGIEVPLMKRVGVERIEYLRHFLQVQADVGTFARVDSPGGRRGPIDQDFHRVILGVESPLFLSEAAAA